MDAGTVNQLGMNQSLIMISGLSFQWYKTPNQYQKQSPNVNDNLVQKSSNTFSNGINCDGDTNLIATVHSNNPI